MKRTGKRPSVLLSLLLFLGIACGGGARDAASLASPVSASAVDPGKAGGNKFVTVMTRNLFLGGEIFEPLFDPDPLGAAWQLWQTVQASDYDGRAADIAAEIVSENPALVGVQEAFSWTEFSLLDGTPSIRLDFLESLMSALASLGVDYRAVVVQPETDLTIPFPTHGVAVHMVDHDVILARGDVDVRATASAEFKTVIGPIDVSVPGLGTLSVNIVRGWTSVDVKQQGVTFRFVNTHMDGDDVLPIQYAQADEIVTELLAPAPMPTVVVGDTNVIADKPDNTVYALFTSVLRDAWRAVGTGPGYTCCFDDIHDQNATLDQRVDLVLLGGALTPKNMSLTGNAFDMENGFWPSDHLGVVAKLRLENPKFFALEQ